MRNALDGCLTVTSRERLRGILARGPYDRWGIFEHYWGETIREAWPAQGYPKDANPYDLFDLDIRGVFCAGSDATTWRDSSATISEDDEHRVYESGWGARYRGWKHRSGTPEHIGFAIAGPESWKPYRDRLLAGEPAAKWDMPRIRQELATARESDRFLVFGHLFVVETLRHALGDIAMLESLILELDWIRDICRVVTDVTLAKFDRIYREAGKPDGIFLYEDFGYTNGLFANPKLMDRLIWPFHRELVEFHHSHGLPVILHSCGGITEAVPYLVDMGFDCIQPMEAKAGVDVVSLARQFGDRTSFMGNIDVTVLNTNDRARVRDHILPKLAALYDLGARYVFHSDHSVPPDVHYDTYRYAVDLFREFCATHPMG